jgi:hypothetical protein
MVINKYTPNESLNRMRLMMNYDISKTLTENKEIASIIDNVNSNDSDFLFDFVISESNGFVIYMDNVFSKKHGFVGHLWENTWVLNEIIRENITKYSNIISESVEKDLDNILMSINWTKEFVAECILSTDTLFEGFGINEQFFDRLKAGAKKIGGNIVRGAKKVGSRALSLGKKLLMGPVLGTLRWIRRNVYTSIGMVVDIVTAMLPATTGINKVIWVMIIFLDFYELISGNKDTKDEARMQNPYMYLVGDLIGLFFTVASGLLFKNSAKAVISGTAKMPSATAKLLQSLLNKLPGLKGVLSSTGSWLTKNFPKIKKLLDVVFRGLDWVIKGVEKFIKQLLSKQGALAVATGASIAWFFKPRLLKRNDTGEDVRAINDYIGTTHNDTWPDIPNCTLSDDIINGVKESGNNYTEYTESAVKQIESCLSKKFPSLIKGVDGKISNQEIAIYASVQMDDRGIVSKIIPHETRKSVENVIGQVMSGAAKFAQDKIEGNKNNV